MVLPHSPVNTLLDNLKFPFVIKHTETEKNDMIGKTPNNAVL